MDWKHFCLVPTYSSTLAASASLFCITDIAYIVIIVITCGASLVYKVLNGLAPRYLGPLTRVADLPGRRTLRSASSNRFHIPVPPVRLSTVSTRAFSIARPRIWNNLPEHITSAGTLHTFCHRLKTHLFQRSYS